MLFVYQHEPELNRKAARNEIAMTEGQPIQRSPGTGLMLANKPIQGTSTALTSLGVRSESALRDPR